nr:dipeptide/oligopeptide/nickel ABC transporter permease/ATP-binding protein [Actinomadura rugatobispora]
MRAISRKFLGNRPAAAGLAVLVVLLAAALCAPLIAAHPPDAQSLGEALRGPSGAHWLGTDDKGRDLFARLLYGARSAFVVCGASAGLAMLIGVPIGLVVGFLGGWWDRVVMRLVDAIVAVPALVLVFALVALLGPGLSSTVTALGLVFSTVFVRLVRGEVLAVREEPYVAASRVGGAGPVRLMATGVLPVIAPAVIMQASLTCGTALLAEAGLSFLGLGVQPPDASWGSMLNAAQTVVDIAPWLAVPPGLAILAMVLCFNVVGDGLRDALARQAAPVRRSRPRLRVPRRAGLSRRAAGPPAVAKVTGPDAGPGAELGREALLVVRDLEISLSPPRTGPPVPVVSGLSFEVAPAEIVGLAGESGCGKTVTALALLGLVPPPGRITRGSIRLGGTELAGASAATLRAARARDLGVVFQEPHAALNPARTVEDQLTEPLRVHLGMSRRRARERAAELLDRVGIPEPAARLGAYPHELSGGMAQRVMIAAAIACEPRLLIADEPTTALDVTVQSQVLDLLADLRADTGMSVLLISHDLGVVADLCDRAIVLYAGEIAESAPVDTLYAAPRHPYTADLLRAVPRNRPGGDLAGIPGSVPRPGAWPAGCRFAPRCASALPGCSAAPVPLRRTGDHQVRCVRADLVTAGDERRTG